MDEPRDALEVPPPLSLDEAQRIIARLEEIVRKQRVVLIGGQAVSIWIGQLQSRLTDPLIAEPIVSRDVDFLGNADDTRLAGKLLDGRVHVSKWADRTTLAGVAIFLDSDGYERRLDFLQSPYGLNAEDVRNTAVYLDLILIDGQQAPVWVMHPERCMESRVHNSVLANKQTDLAWRQLRASILCARAFSQLLLDERLGEKFRTVRLPQMHDRIWRLRQLQRDRRST